MISLPQCYVGPLKIRYYRCYNGKKCLFQENDNDFEVSSLVDTRREIILCLTCFITPVLTHVTPRVEPF